ncbi:acetaldehyde dehydrogenase / alcohol dehydrogenase [Desulfuromonas thiophila]|uniref:Acetaldehyde dehydrogenase / alcohol dehydrogenase n=2 Tax=Desulfuromonas thiophila TaxID=57664 RepID=A0A1G7F6T8_9BACT|nr:aldehyde dehydrogenase family protein [Desulfuromonas thiophila]SDE71599.1 acetaldehyde dehydrogenase / alcohol dehydrogenase [Desulfuromonas thiophila]
MSNVASQIDQMILRAQKAAQQFQGLTQEDVERITEAMASAGVASKERLAEMAVKETGIGKVADKIIKNNFGTQVVYDYMKGQPSVGIIEEDNGIISIAEPFGVIAAVTPVTNPTSTTMFKALIALKGRNVICFAFHPKAQNCSVEAARIVLDAAVKAGAPENCIQWIETPSIEATDALMSHPNVDMIIATGGGAMVKAAYSSGHPALGVGPGNVPVFIEKTADLQIAIPDVIASKTFDNGTICSSDQSVIFDDAQVAEKALQLFQSQGAYLCNKEEKAKLEAVMFDKDRGVPFIGIVGKSPQFIADLAGFSVSEDIKMLMVPLDTTGPEDWMSHEKLSPVLGWYITSSKDEAIAAARCQLEFGGAGHSAVIFTQNEAIAREYALSVPANRVVWNQPSVHGTIGALYNAFVPSLTLGCGAKGGNITTENVGYKNLLNIKRLARRNAA